MISVFYRAPGAPVNAFHSVGSSTVTANTPVRRGRFTSDAGPREGGAWRTEFAGDAYARPCVSNSDSSL
ncbi:hypothetical protein [Nonomuraea lactucae]|uniref:hypothetical protein n=1 Tax=Nonomuraea lactucae TaxID=2249762 RepID=UPI000DE20BC1|nr:hypothetical protein [Nonomuraea lactucae]